jgi:hypothetical protein
MITIPKYQIPNFQNIRFHYDFGERVDLQFASMIACLYYEFAYYRMLGFSDICNKNFQDNTNDNRARNTYLNQSWSEAYAMYALLRTCIEAVRKINKELISENKIESYYKDRIKNIVDITNDVIKHPMFNDINDPKDASQAFRPNGLDIGGNIDVERWIDHNTPSSILTISPMQDFEAVKSYLEHIADILKIKI